LRADWIRIYDLSFVEDELIAGLEMYIKDADRYLGDLQLKAQGLAAAQAAKEEAIKSGTAGLGQTEARRTTRPQSPKITRARPAKFHEPITIEQTVSHLSVAEREVYCCYDFYVTCCILCLFCVLYIFVWQL
jgi:hypothetical protein